LLELRNYWLLSL